MFGYIKGKKVIIMYRSYKRHKAPRFCIKCKEIKEMAEFEQCDNIKCFVKFCNNCARFLPKWCCPIYMTHHVFCDEPCLTTFAEKGCDEDGCLQLFGAHIKEEKHDIFDEISDRLHYQMERILF
jgi:hypothetical protein